MRSKEIIKRLDQLTERHPQLKPLRSQIDKTLVPTKAFLSAYRRSKVHYSQKSLLIRVLLEDASIYGTDVVPLTPALHKRVLQFLLNDPNDELSPFGALRNREGMPSFLCAHKGIRRPTARDILLEYVIEPLQRPRTAKGLRPLLEQALAKITLDEKATRKLLASSVRGATSIRFFDTGWRVLDVRNGLLFALKLLQEDSRGGRIQSKIPKALSEALGIARISVPELTAVCDMLSLELLTDSVSPADGHSLAEVLTGESPQKLVKALDIRDLAHAHVAHNFVDNAKCERVLARTEAGRRNHAYRSGVLFNPERLYQGTRQIAAFTRYTKHAERISTMSMVELLGKHFLPIDKDFFNAMMAVIGDRNLSAMACRGYCNTVFYANWLDERDENIMRRLPAVAKYLMGMREPTPAGGRHKTSRGRGRRGSQEIPREEPLLSDLEDALSLVGNEGLLNQWQEAVLAGETVRGFFEWARFQRSRGLA